MPIYWTNPERRQPARMMLETWRGRMAKSRGTKSRLEHVAEMKTDVSESRAFGDDGNGTGLIVLSRAFTTFLGWSPDKRLVLRPIASRFRDRGEAAFLVETEP